MLICTVPHTSSTARTQGTWLQSLSVRPRCCRVDQLISSTSCGSKLATLLQLHSAATSPMVHREELRRLAVALDADIVCRPITGSRTRCGAVGGSRRMYGSCAPWVALRAETMLPLHAAAAKGRLAGWLAVSSISSIAERRYCFGFCICVRTALAVWPAVTGLLQLPTQAHACSPPAFQTSPAWP